MARTAHDTEDGLMALALLVCAVGLVAALRLALIREPAPIERAPKDLTARARLPEIPLMTQQIRRQTPRARRRAR
jgi:hypothetical protein